MKQLYKLYSISLALLLANSSFAFGGGGNPDTSLDYAGDGPYATTSYALSGSCTVFRPTNLTANHPVIIWGNGTGATLAIASSGLHHLASWGFVVSAAHTPNSGSGNEMLDCLDQAANASFASALDLSKVGATGHSQGGGGAIAAGRDSRITATAPIQPYTLPLLGHQSSWNSQQNGPMLLLGGSADIIAVPLFNQVNVFYQTNVPVFYAERQGASHFEPAFDFGSFRGLITSWFLYQLSGDSQAATLFQGSNCSMCDVNDWDVETRNNP